ncbi:hypothetical protein [Rhizobium sp. Root482]|uniref:hypothetical protein n=1 Tax=Rhizobium sp. Root482 TaxID=1736543 RepID=UPI0006FE96DE|nr:hypothetical protein [Rhizobium sp. Root482]KQY26220.1 hypothetical protein ASD31_19645 [Rhizobium sp. Root482]
MITTLIEDWQARSALVKEKLRLKYVPFNPTPEMIEQAEAFLSLPNGERSHRLETAHNDEVEFLISLETARALYENPLEKRDGSITEAKVARSPERYR